MTNNKSHGQGGLTADLHKIFWSGLKDLYYASFLGSISSGNTNILKTKCGNLMNSLKCEKDYLKIYRPLSLHVTNVDY